MAKKHLRKGGATTRSAPQTLAPLRRAPEITPDSSFSDSGTGGDALKSRILWLLAAILIVLGYALLHKVDPAGQNRWAIASPALLLGGYLLIIPAIAYTYRR